jgi:hypothetical protein
VLLAVEPFRHRIVGGGPEDSLDVGLARRSSAATAEWHTVVVVGGRRPHIGGVILPGGMVSTGGSLDQRTESSRRGVRWDRPPSRGTRLIINYHGLNHIRLNLNCGLNLNGGLKFSYQKLIWAIFTIRIQG